MEKQTTSPSAPSSGFGHERAAQERKIMLTVGAFFLLAVAMWLTNKYFGPPELQSNLVTSGDFAIGTDKNTYSTGSGTTVRVPLFVEYPTGQRLVSLRIALSPWPKSASKPTFVPSTGTSLTPSVTMTGSGTVIFLENVSLPPSNLGEVGSIEFTTRGGTPSTTIGLISDPTDRNGTMITTVGLGGKKQETRLRSPDFFRLEASIGGIPVTGTGATPLLRPAAGSVFLLPNVSSLLKRFFGMVPPANKPITTGSGSQMIFKSSAAASGSNLKGAAPAGRSPSAPGADLAVEIQLPKGQVNVGEAFQAKAIVRNDGAARATNVKFSMTFPEQIRVIIGSMDRAGCSATAQAVSCTFATLDGGQIVSVPIDVRPTATGNFAVQATLKADQTETNNANNQAKATVMAVKAVAASPSPSASSSPAAAPTLKPTPVPKQEKLPKTGPLPIGLALIGLGVGILLRSKVWR